MVFNVVAHNQDDHTKNFLFLMSEEGDWSLAPAYDITYSYRPGSFWVEQHNISLNGRRSEFAQADLLAVLSQIGNFPMSDALEIIRECTRAVSQWRLLASKNNVSKSLIDEIEGNLRLDL